MPDPNDGKAPVTFDPESLYMNDEVERRLTPVGEDGIVAHLRECQRRFGPPPVGTILGLKIYLSHSLRAQGKPFAEIALFVLPDVTAIFYEEQARAVEGFDPKLMRELLAAIHNPDASWMVLAEPALAAEPANC